MRLNPNLIVAFETPEHRNHENRARYGMSMIANLGTIREQGLEGFVALEKKRWKCAACGGVICVHREDCIYCGHVRS